MGTEAMEVDPSPSKDKQEKEKPAAEKKDVDLNIITFENMREWCNQLERGDTQIVGRVLQLLNRTRKQLNTDLLSKLCNTYLYASPALKKQLISWLPVKPSSSESMEVDGARTPNTAKSASGSQAQKKQQPVRKTTPVPELELYIHLLVLLHLTDEKNYELALVCAKNFIEYAEKYDKRLLDPFLAKGYFYLSLISEHTGRIETLPLILNSQLRFATLRRQYELQATLIPSSSLKCSFPETASNNNWARFFYYVGRIRALQLQYAEAAQFFQQSLQKAPQDSAIGFKQNVQKWIVVMSLLRGEIPERSIFRATVHRVTLLPYLNLTHGSLFVLATLLSLTKVLEKYSNAFEADETLTLIVRLRQNVIRTAIRQISLAYSRIPIKEIAAKLQLPNEAEAEYVIAKAIHDKIVDAIITVDPKTSSHYMQTVNAEDIYRTTEPQFAFDTRIRNCLDLHNLAVKALRYPENKKQDEGKTEQQRERELLELELASEMPDDDDEF
ncbi:26S proteasome non-ATPase regulatory subunit 3 [Aphelenchoides bicaudatus]|nr:26S proteasome non-ATPase regulatory subunit 3 [Aphelenchoides bicaudatus]